jgi:beta-carotene 15,15'-dioxygenase
MVRFTIFNIFLENIENLEINTFLKPKDGQCRIYSLSFKSLIIMQKVSILKNLNTEFILLLVGLFTLLYHLFLVPIGNDTQMIILLSLVLIVGVPHGALDFLVDEQNETLQNNAFSITKFVGVYLTRLFAFALFWFLPWLAFTLFIIFSIFHFGETDMSAIVKPNKYAVLLYFSYGSFILSILLLFHLSEIQDSLPAVSVFLKEHNIYSSLIKFTPHIIILFSTLFISTLLMQKRKGFIREISLYEIVQFVGLLLVLIYLPLMLAFTFYFALWHSILSVRNIFSYFKNYNSSKKFTLICGKSLLFSFLALGSIIGLYFVMKVYMPDFNMLFALLIVLSVLTLPHLTVMHGMYKNYSKAFN